MALPFSSLAPSTSSYPCFGCLCAMCTFALLEPPLLLDACRASTQSKSARPASARASLGSTLKRSATSKVAGRASAKSSSGAAKGSSRLSKRHGSSVESLLKSRDKLRQQLGLKKG